MEPSIGPLEHYLDQVPAGLTATKDVVSLGVALRAYESLGALGGFIKIRGLFWGKECGA